jgi:S-adenosyl methyltransferase
MAVEQGIRQFIDIGSGLPTQSNTHEVVRPVAAGAKVAYVDNDPMVEVLANELLTDDGATAVIVADLRDPGAVLGHAHMRALIDFGEPVGLLMTAVLQFVADEDDPWGLVGRYLAALCPGSYLALSHITRDKLPPRLVETGVKIYQRASESAFPRTLPEIERFFTGLAVVPPYEGAGSVLTNVGMWGSEDPASADTDGSRAFYCGVARRP